MKNNLTELVFILDRSGSMSGLEGDTIGGYNSLLWKQKQDPGEAVVTTVLFDNHFEILHDRINIKGVAPITEKEYFVGGSTALLDAIGLTIGKIGKAQQYTSEAERASQVMVVIITDGMENASREYHLEQIRQLIERQKSQFGWEFLFLGANIDAVATAAQFGIAEDRAANYFSDSQGTELNYQVLSDTVSEFRACKAIKENWKNAIEEDLKKRKKK